MNCQDVALILDDRDAAALDAAEKNAVDAHLAICADCTRDWQVHTRLVAALVPVVPAGLPAQIRSLLAAPVSRPHDWRWSKQLLLMGALFAAGAAAALLVDRLAAPEPPAASITTATSAPVPAATPTPARVPAPGAAINQTGMPPGPAQFQPRIARDRSGSGQAAVVAGPIRVQVLPLLNQATGDATAAVDAEFAAFLEGLRAMPGVALVSPDSAGEAVDYRLTIRGVGPLADGKFRVALATETREASGEYRGTVSMSSAGDINASCDRFVSAAPPVLCMSPKMVAAMQVQFLISTVFTSSTALPRDPAAQRRSILNVASSSDARGRASAWRTARGLGDPEFLQPLLAALRSDSDATVRAWAAGALAADFSDDPRVRAALETAATNDAHPMVRAFVHRALSGNKAAWKACIVESLHDTSRSAMERLEPLIFELEQPPATLAEVEALLKSPEVIEPVTALLSGMKTWPRDSGLLIVLTRLGAIPHPAVTSLLVDNMDRYQELMMGGSNLVYLLSRQAGDPRARAALEKLSREDPDPNLRRNAADALRKIAAGAVQSPTR